MKHSEQLDKLAGALAAAQGKVKGALKDSANPFFKSKYADLDSVWAACREALQAHSLSVVQVMGMSEKFGPTLVTTLLHSSGQWISGEQPVMAKTDSPQDLGSAITYARRYGLAAIVGVVQVDDDAESAMNRTGAGDRSSPKPQGNAGNSAAVAAHTSRTATAIKERLSNDESRVPAPGPQKGPGAAANEAEALGGIDERVDEFFASAGAEKAAPAAAGLPGAAALHGFRDGDTGDVPGMDARSHRAKPIDAQRPQTEEEKAWFVAHVSEILREAKNRAALQAAWVGKWYIIKSLPQPHQAALEAVKEEMKAKLVK